MVYSYPFTLARRAVVATCDLTAKNLHLLETSHWLRDRRNVRVLRLTSPAFGDATAADAQHMTPEATMRSWGVDAVVNPLKRRTRPA